MGFCVVELLEKEEGFYRIILWFFCELIARLKDDCTCIFLYSSYVISLFGYICLKRLYGSRKSISIFGLNWISNCC